MIAQIVPGLREVRAPLAGGVLWILLVWLAFGDRVPTRREVELRGGVLSRLYEADTVVSQLGRGVLFGVAAYLLGSLAVAATSRFSEALERRMAPSPSISALLVRIGVEEVNANLELRDALKEHAVSEATFLGEIPIEGFGLLIDDLAVLKISLLATSETLHSEVDRPDAEADLRSAIGPPIAIISLILGCAHDPAWFLGIGVAAALMAQGIALRRYAREALTTSIYSTPSLRERFALAVAERVFAGVGSG
jgi:hypothetical protein